MKAFFANKKPYSFIVSGPFDKTGMDFISFCKHLNVYMAFFDRTSPQVLIFNQEPETAKYKIPCLSKKKFKFS